MFGDVGGRFPRIVMRWIKSQVINAKWIWDKRHLPLTEDHKELYEIIHSVYFWNIRRLPNLVNPADYNERIQWLKLFDQSEEIIRCSDKVLARDYIRERVGEQYLVKLYQVCDHFSEIDFDALPDAFVVKANHDSGSVIRVHHKGKLDKKAAEIRLETALKSKYGWDAGEWAYAFIRPRILIEEFLEPHRPTPIPDYKFHCVNGKVMWLQYIFDRNHGTKEAIVDSLGRVTDVHFDHNMQHVMEFDKPEQWGQLCDVAEKLAAGWKYVRIDLFLSKGQIYVGEMTFYPLAGCYKGAGQKKLGKLLNFEMTSFNSPVYRRLTKEPDVGTVSAT